MGVYATTTSISVILPKFLKGDSTTTDTQGTAIFAKAITRAEDEINSLLGSRFNTPFAAGSVPPALTTYAEDLATYYAVRGSYTQDGQIKQVYADAYRDARENVMRIADGKAGLFLSDGSQAPSKSTGRFKSTTKTYTPIFGRDTQSSWKRDDNEITDMENERA